MSSLVEKPSYLDAVKSYTTDNIPKPIKNGANALVGMTTNWLTAKLNPLSSPPGWDQEKRATEKKIKRLRAINSHAEKQLKAFLYQESPDHLTSQVAKQSPQKIKLERARENLPKFKEQLHNAEAHDKHLDTIWYTEIAGRFAGYASKALAFVFPTAALVPNGVMADLIPEPTAFLVDSALKVALVGTHVKGADGLPGASFKADEQAKAHRRKIKTVACTIATMTFFYFYRSQFDAAKNQIFRS